MKPRIRSFGHHRPMAWAIRGVLAVGGTWVGAPASAAPASAATTSAAAVAAAPVFAVDRADPERSIPSLAAQNADPFAFAEYLQGLIAEAEAATAAGAHDRAARFYRTLSRAVPDRSVAFSKLCGSLLAAGHTGEAIAACQNALSREGAVVNDFITYVRLALAQPGSRSPIELGAIRDAINHLESQTAPESKLAGHHLRCELGLTLPGIEDLQSCTGGLAAIAPDDPKTVAFAWALAMRQERREEARQLYQRARAVNLPAAGLERMERAMAAQANNDRFGFAFFVAAVIAACFASGLAFVLVRARSGSKHAARASAEL
jgi:tetratricopeptide (TPR) repeat protein